MYVCLYVRVHVIFCVHARARPLVCYSVRACVPVCVTVFVWMYVYMCMLLCTCLCYYVCMDGWMDACMYSVCVRACVRACVCVCLSACLRSNGWVGWWVGGFWVRASRVMFSRPECIPWKLWWNGAATCGLVWVNRDGIMGMRRWWWQVSYKNKRKTSPRMHIGCKGYGWSKLSFYIPVLHCNVHMIRTPGHGALKVL